MSLPEPWVERIFAKLAVTYGQRFLGLYAGVDMATVRANWGHELAAYAQAPEAIRYALEHLPPDNPPTVLQFRAICRNRPIQAPKALPAPKPDMAKVSHHLARLQQQRGKYPKAWAHRLKDRESRGDSLTQFQRDAWREALRTTDTSDLEEAQP